MNFAQPLWLAAGIVAVPALTIGYLLAQRRTKRHTRRFVDPHLLDRIAPQRPRRSRHLPTALILLGLTLLAVALAGPTADAKEPRNRATVMLAIDVSLSMQATDVAPNRFAAAQQAATRFVDDLTPGINLGIVSFAGIATVLVSPTTDRAAAKQAIAGLTLDERTATGDAIVSCVQTIDRFAKTLASVDGTTGPVPARIVLMTDGKRTTGRTEQDAAQQAADAKIPVSVIAFGTDHGAITVDGRQIPVPLDTQALQQIARTTGGDFHTAATTEELTSVYAQLGEQIGYETTQQDVSRPWLIAGTVIVLIGSAAALLITTRIP